MMNVLLVFVILLTTVRGATECRSDQYFGDGDSAVGIVCSGDSVSASQSLSMEHKDYFHMADIPKGARNVRIKTTVGTGTGSQSYRSCDIDTLLMRGCSSNDANCYNRRSSPIG